MEWTEFNKKLNRWHEFTENKWWLRSCGEPLLFKFLWKLKFQVRPPYFANPFWLALGSGSFFGFSMLLFTKMAMELSGNQLSLKFIILNAYGGISFGTIMATLFWAEARMRKLPRWEDLSLLN